MDSNVSTVAEAKRVASVNDIIIPAPQGSVSIALLLEQTGLNCELGLYRDHQSPTDPWFDKADTIDLANGSVFYTGEPTCDPPPTCDAPAKHVVTLNDHPEIVLQTQQSEAAIRRLFNIEDAFEILVDTMSPNDPILEFSDTYDLREGNVLLAKLVSIEVKVNKHPIVFTKRKNTGHEIKETAIKQGAELEADFILMVEKDGINLPVEDDEVICLETGYCFKAIRPDDNSYGSSSKATTKIESALLELKRQFAGHKIDFEDVSNGVNVVVHGFPLDERYQQNETWIGFHIHNQYPQGDIYPHFVRSDLSANPGYSLPAAMLQQRPFANKPARMISRKSPRWNPLQDTAATKLLKIIQYISKG